MVLSSEDAGIWVLPVVFLLGLALVSPVGCVLLAGRVVLRVARSAAAGQVWDAFTPGTWLLAAGAGAFGAGCRFSVLLFASPVTWVDSASFVCGCFTLVALAMAALTAALRRHLTDAADRS
ncbi:MULTISPECIES: hypothetical protein [unclassified Streptomyces]|uniref:hypothetical protein n=1 Tax=unclassified Streptomyces TaxID=2593676 RepID=UPI0033A7FE85